MKTLSTLALVLLLVLLTGAYANATVILLPSPNIDFDTGVDQKLVEALRRVVGDKRFQFLGGGQYMGWGPEHDSTSLLYGGDTKALAEFLSRLNRAPGLQVTVRLVHDISSELIPEQPDFAVIDGGELKIKYRAKPVPSWEAEYYKHPGDRIEVSINLAAKGIRVEGLIEELARRAAVAQGQPLRRTKPVVAEKSPVRDYSLADSGTILNLVLTDWFTNPRHREEALSLLNDIPSEPSGTPRPALRRVVIDVRAVPKKSVPAIPGIPTILADRDKRLLFKGELGIWVSHFEPQANGTVEIEFAEENYGYTGNSARYRVHRKAGKYQVEFVSSDLGE